MIEPIYAGASLELNRHIVNLLDSLSAIQGLTEISLGDVDEFHLPKLALEALMSNQDMECCSIFLLDGDGLLSNAAGMDWDDMLRGIFSPGEDTVLRPPGKNRFRSGEGIMGRAAASGEIERCPSCGDDPQFKKFGDGGHPVQGALLCVPITCEGKVLGALNVFYPVPGFFNLWHERLLLLFCKILGRMLISRHLMHHLNTMVDGKTKELVAINEALHSKVEEMRLAATVLGSMSEAVVVTDQDNNIIEVNPAFTAITGYSAGEVIGKNPRMFSSGRHPPAFYHEMWETLTTTGKWSGEMWNRRKDGEIYVETASITLIRDEGGDLIHYVAVFSDITERKAAEEKVRYLAHYDALTDLPNRTLFTDRLRQALIKAKRDKVRMALMFIDLDEFKPVNDRYGHNIGDMLLRETAQRMRDCVRDSDTVARVGGDEFVVLLPAIEAVQDAIAVAEKIRSTLAQTYELAGHSLHISSSIGIAVYPEHGSEEKALLKNADIAMYYAKASGRNTVKLFPMPEQEGDK